jgi:oxygen-independent coproporphyrinogen-3 oxidase
MVRMTQEWMEANGYEQNGRFSDGRQWEYRYHWLHEMPIIAFGSRARSYTQTLWYDNYEDLPTYSLMIGKGIPPVGRRISLTLKEQMYRSLFLSLQLKSGLDIRQFQKRFHENPLVVFAPLLAKLHEYGCIEQAAGSVRLTRYGAWFVEDVCDYITDAALREESNDLVRSPHSTGTRLPAIS